MLAGVLLPILSQTILLWQVLLAAIVLKKQLTPAQVRRTACGCTLHGAHAAQMRAGRPAVAFPPGHVPGAKIKSMLLHMQVAGVCLVLGGVCLAAWPSGGSSPLAGVSTWAAALFMFSMLFPVG